MKTHFTLFIIALLITLNCPAQKIDGNGVQISNSDVNTVSPPFQNPSVLSPYVYDTVRALSEINVAGQADAYPWLSADGLRLYYLSATLNNMAYTSRPNTSSYFDPPVLANAVFPSGTFSCWFSADELDVYYISGASLYYAHRNTIASAFNTPVYITVNGATPFSACSLDPTQNELYFYNSTISRCVRTSATSFDFTYNVPCPVGSYNPGQLSKDGLVFFVSVPSVSSSALYSLTRATLNDSLTNPQPVQGISIPGNPYSTQPSMSDSLEWVVLVSSTADIWGEDDLAIAGKDNTTSSVFDPEKINFMPTVYPNPVAERLHFRVSKAMNKKSVISIYSVQNSFIEKRIIDAETALDVTGYNNGIYLYTISDDAGSFICNGKFAVMH